MSTQKIINKTFEQENDDFLKYILDARIFNILKNPNQNDFIHEMTNIELYITSECNLSCEYCYLSKFGDNLYPKEIRNKDLILNNLKILMNHFLKEQYIINDMELFSGEIWGTPFSFKIFDEILEAISQGLKINKIIIPSNMTFIVNDEAIKKIQYYIDEYEKNKVRIMFSASIDGLYLENYSRPYCDASKNCLRDEEYYDKIFTFCKKNNYGFHPMISASTVKYQIENHKWFLKMMKKYEIDYGDNIMFLEVRNDDWTQEAIDDYLKFLDYLIIELKNNFYSSEEEMIEDIFSINNQRAIKNYNAIGLTCNHTELGCTIHKNLHIRLGDLAIVPCHRLSYESLIYGYYKVENNEIIGIKSNNPQMALKTYFQNIITGHQGCDTCAYRNLCMKGCLGAQYEATKDLWFPCNTVCEFYKQKTNFLIKKYEDMGLIKKLKEQYPDDKNAIEILAAIKELKESL